MSFSLLASPVKEEHCAEKTAIYYGVEFGRVGLLCRSGCLRKAALGELFFPAQEVVLAKASLCALSASSTIVMVLPLKAQTKIAFITNRVYSGSVHSRKVCTAINNNFK